MSLYDNPPNTEAKATAARLLKDAIALVPSILAEWRNAMDALWDGDTAAILAEFGTRGLDAFLDSSATVAFLEHFSPGCTADRISKIRAYTIQQDGTVTLDPA